MDTYMPSGTAIERKWYVVDATDMTLGRLSSEAAKVLTGKNKPTYTPFLDMGDNLIVINAAKVKVTGKKLDQKIYYRHSEYVGGLKSATLMTIRMIVLIIGTSVMTLTTTPNSLTDGLEKGLRFLTVFKVPVHEISMMMSIALRFIPILIEETDKIMKAQMARGADFESGGIFQKAKSMVPILVPLFVSAFRRANDLALAMEARCYNGGDGRTNMKPLKYAGIDAVSYVCIFVFLGVCIAAKVLL